MNCRKAQRLIGERPQRLPPPLQAALHQHLQDCTDCRVTDQRITRLQQLLALKRHEQPPPGYFEGFLSEFHSRLMADTRQPQTFWQPLRIAATALLHAPTARRCSYAVAGSVAAAVVAALVWMAAQPAQPPPAPGTAPVATIAPLAPSPAGAAVTIQGVPVSGPAAVVVLPATAQPAPNRPRYVLDRINAPAAGYEVASVHF
jgi:AcrR family transcriptional regulator